MNMRVVLGSLLAVLVGAGFYFLAISPIIENTNVIEGETAAAEQQGAALTGERNRLLRIQENELHYIDAVGELEASIPTSPNQSELINAFEALATESAVDWEGASFGQPTASAEAAYNEISLNVQVSGQYFELLGYLYSMQDLDRLVRIDSATFAPSVDENIVDLAVTISATAFTTGEVLVTAPVEEEPAPESTEGATEDDVEQTEEGA